jgi:hypothetical protein
MNARKMGKGINNKSGKERKLFRLAAIGSTEELPTSKKDKNLKCQISNFKKAPSTKRRRRRRRGRERSVVLEQEEFMRGDHAHQEARKDTKMADGRWQMVKAGEAGVFGAGCKTPAGCRRSQGRRQMAKAGEGGAFGEGRKDAGRMPALPGQRASRLAAIGFEV